MNKLFKPALEFTKEASELIYLDADPTNWVKQLITSFFTKFPQLRTMPVTITWIKQDNEHGTAIGVLNALGGVIPIIIKDWSAYPLDTILFNNAAIPLNEQTISELVSSPTPFSGVSNINPKISLQIFGDGKLNASPVEYGNRNQEGESTGTTRDAVKVAEFGLSLGMTDVTFGDKLTDMTKEDYRVFFSKYAQESELIRKSLEKSDAAGEVIAKYAEYAEKAKDLNLDITIDRAYIFTDDLGNSHIKVADSRYDYAKTEKLTPTLKKLAKNIFADEQKVQNSPEIPESMQEIVLEKGASGDLVVGDKTFTGITVIAVENTEKLEKTAFYTTFNGKHGLVVTKDGAEWDYVAPGFVKEASSQEISFSSPSVGDFGIFVSGDKATEPFKIIASVNDVIYGSNMLQKVAYTISNYEIPSVKDGIVTFLPKSAKFVKLGSKMKDSAEKLVKIASLNADKKVVFTNSLKFTTIFTKTAEKDSNLVEIEKDVYVSSYSPVLLKKTAKIEKTARFVVKNGLTSDSVGKFYLKGPEFQKYAKLGHEVSNLDKNDAIWAAVALGASGKDVENISNMGKNASYVLSNDLKVPASIEEANSLIKSAQSNESLNIWLLKEAAVINDKSSVDAILSLGLMNKANINEYTALIPDYERVLGELTKLLILARLGVNAVPEGAVKTVVDSLSDVLYILKGIQQLQK